jgi:hypothetical protein
MHLTRVAKCRVHTGSLTVHQATTQGFGHLPHAQVSGCVLSGHPLTPVRAAACRTAGATHRTEGVVVADAKKHEEPLFEEFDHAVYARCSNNNMPMFASFVPLTDDEQEQVDDALALS